MPSASPRSPGAVFCLAAAGTFLAYLDVTIVNIAFPDIARDFDGAALGALSWVVNAYALAFAALLVVLGRVADRAGRRLVYLTGAGLFAAASVACAVAPSVGVLVAARTVQGLAAAAMIPAALGLLLAAFPPQRWAAVIAGWGAVGSVAAALGPPIGGLLSDGASWRWIFVINVPVGIATVVVGLRMLRESRAAETARPDVPGAVLLAGATGALALGLVQGDAWGWTSAATLGAFAGAIVAGGLLALRTRRLVAPASAASEAAPRHTRGAAVSVTALPDTRRVAPVFEPELLRSRWTRAANAGTLAFGAALFASQLCAVLFATGVWGWSTLEAGLAAVPGPIASAIAAPLGGRWASRSGPRPVAIFGAALFAAALAWVVLTATEEPNFLGVWLPYGIVGGAGIGLGLPALIGATATGLPPGRFATGMALATTARQLGAVLGVALLVAVVGTPAPGDAVSAYDAGFALCAGALAVSALFATLLKPEVAAAPAVAGEAAVAVGG